MDARIRANARPAAIPVRGPGDPPLGAEGLRGDGRLEAGHCDGAWHTRYAYDFERAEAESAWLRIQHHGGQVPVADAFVSPCACLAAAATAQTPPARCYKSVGVTQSPGMQAAATAG
jgi:hypothetical protein